jgi:hypothetical protein
VRVLMGLSRTSDENSRKNRVSNDLTRVIDPRGKRTVASQRPEVQELMPIPKKRVGSSGSQAWPQERSVCRRC